MLRWLSLGMGLFLVWAPAVLAQESEPSPTEQIAGEGGVPAQEAEPVPEPAPAEPSAPEPTAAAAEVEELFDPAELIRADEESSEPTPTAVPEPPAAEPTPEPPPAEPPPTEEPPAEPEAEEDDDEEAGDEAEVEPAPSVNVEEERRKEIGDLEAQAQKYFNSLNYTRPARTNVVDVSKEILKRDPGNAKVRELIDKMVEYYKRKGAEAMNARAYARAADQYGRILLVDLFGEHRAFAEQKVSEAKSQQASAPPPSDKPEVLLKNAEDAFRRQDYKEARKFYQAILDQIPDDILARKGLEKTNQLLGIEPEGTPEERIAYFRQAGESFLEWQNFEEAKFYYDKILAIDPNDEDAKAKLQMIDDALTPKGKLVVQFQGDAFWWSTKMDPRISGEESKAHIELVMKLDGETKYFRTDSEVEEPVKEGKKGHAKNVYAFQDDYSFEDLKAGAHTLEIIVRGGAAEASGQWTSSIPVQITANQVTELRLKTTEKLKYSKRKGRMSGEFRIEPVR